MCELLDTEPKAQCKVCLSYFYCTCGHFLRNGTEENKKFVQYTMDLLSIPNYYIKKGDPTGTVTGRSSPIRSRRSAKRETSWVSTTDSYETKSSARTCLTTVELKKFCRQMDDLADEDHTHHFTPEEIDDYRVNWWIRSNKIGSDTMPIRHRSDFKQALSTLRQLKDKEAEAQRNQRWTQSYSSSWWNWQGSWWHSSNEHHHEDVPSTD